MDTLFVSVYLPYHIDGVSSIKCTLQPINSSIFIDYHFMKETVADTCGGAEDSRHLVFKAPYVSHNSLKHSTGKMLLGKE